MYHNDNNTTNHDNDAHDNSTRININMNYDNKTT